MNGTTPVALQPIRLGSPFSQFLNTPVSSSRGWEIQTPALGTARGREENALPSEATLRQPLLEILPRPSAEAAIAVL